MILHSIKIELESKLKILDPKKVCLVAYTSNYYYGGINKRKIELDYFDIKIERFNRIYDDDRVSGFSIEYLSESFNFGNTVFDFKKHTENIPDNWIVNCQILKEEISVKEFKMLIEYLNLKEDIKLGLYKINPPQRKDIQMHNMEDIEDGETKEVAISNVGRHELMLDKQTETSIQKTKEIELAHELGLTNQAIHSNSELLKDDIDHLTKSNDYYLVTEKILNKMFSIRKLKNKCVIHNIQSFVSTLSTSFFGLGILGVVLCIANIYGFYYAFAINKTTIVKLSSFITMAGFVSLTCFGFTNADGRKLKFKYILTKLKTENIQHTKKKIPYGAMLKLKEAKDSGIFKDFVIAYPDVQMVEREYEFKLPQLSTDPAILGITDDKRTFMICWWDIKADIDKAEQEIDWIKKFKIEV